MVSCWREKACKLDSLRRICLRGRLLSSTKLLTDEGEYEVAPETFYEVGEIYIFQLNIETYPWRITRAIRLKC